MLVEFRYHRSEQLQRKLLASTGQVAGRAAAARIDLAALDPQVRGRVVELLGLPMVEAPDTAYYVVSAPVMPRVNSDAGIGPTQRPMSVGAFDLRPDEGVDVLRQDRLVLDDELTPDNLPTVLDKIAAARAAAEDRLREVRQEANRLLAERERRRQEAMARCEAAIAEMEQADDATLLARVRQAGRIDLPTDVSDSLAQRREALVNRAQALVKAAREAEEAERRARAAARDAEKRAWVEAHGSDYLKRALAAGYDCQRRYVSERVNLEVQSKFPESQVVIDFEGQADWQDRSCPSEPALDWAEKVGGRVVWLRTPPQEEPGGDDEYEKEYEPREAVLIQDYLGKYNLFWLDWPSQS